MIVDGRAFPTEVVLEGTFETNDLILLGSTLAFCPDDCSCDVSSCVVRRLRRANPSLSLRRKGRRVTRPFASAIAAQRENGVFDRDRRRRDDRKLRLRRVRRLERLLAGHCQPEDRSDVALGDLDSGDAERRGEVFCSCDRDPFVPAARGAILDRKPPTDAPASGIGGAANALDR